MKKKPTIKELAAMYSKKGCNVTATCMAYGMDRKTFYNWKAKKPKLAEMLTEAEESLVDYAESKLVEHIQSGDTTCLIFYLKTKGKKRGYVERIENDVSVNPFLDLMKAATSSDD